VSVYRGAAAFQTEKHHDTFESLLLPQGASCGCEAADNMLNRQKRRVDNV
jgi:hypothetical protein